MKIIISLFAASLISGCTTTPSSKTLSSPHPHQTKYTVQCLLVTSPDSLIQELIFNDNIAALYSDLQLPTFELIEENHPVNTPGQKLSIPIPIPILTQPQIEMVLDHPDVEVLEFPLVCAGVGESVTNDQTKTAAMAVDADVVDGKVVYTKEPYKFGESVSVTVNKVEGNAVTYKVDVMHQKFKAFHEYKTKDGLVIKMPYFEKRAVKTEITQPPYVWTALGGFINQINDGPKTHKMIIIRIIPPLTYN